MSGRGGWTKRGHPPNGTGFYKLIFPVHVGNAVPRGDDESATEYAQRLNDVKAVNFGVRAIQIYVNDLFALHGLPPIPVDGVFGPTTDQKVKVAQYVSSLKPDGNFGPVTARAFFWPTIKALCDQDTSKAFIAGGMCNLESGFDPGAVGYVVDSDKGLAQINLAANPHITQAQAFAPKFALRYLVNRLTSALAHFTNRDAAIVQHNSPLWAEQWEAQGSAPNPTAQQYVDLVKKWRP